MHTIKREQAIELANVVEQLEAAGAGVHAASIDYITAVYDYNQTLTEAIALRDAVVEEQEVFFANQSEDWQESPAGEAHQEWVDSWIDVDLEDVEEIDEFENVQHDALQSLKTAIE